MEISAAKHPMNGAGRTLTRLFFGMLWGVLNATLLFFDLCQESRHYKAHSWFLTFAFELYAEKLLATSKKIMSKSDWIHVI